MATIDIDKYHFLRKWKKEQRAILSQLHPELSKDTLNEFLDEEIIKSLVNPKVELHNDYIHKSVKDDLLNIVNWIHNTKPILGGFGVFFKNQLDVVNPAAIMLDKFMILRKDYKKMLEEFLESSYEYKTYDRLQLTEKINANSFYGASGAPTSIFYNLYAATSVTGASQSLISTTEQAFEAFLSNNTPFIDMDDCMHYLENIRKEKNELDSSFLPNITFEELFNRLKRKFYEYKDDYGPFLTRYLLAQSDEFIKRAYFKNNIYEFSFLPKIRNKLSNVVERVDEFKNPNRVPEAIKGNMNDLWDYYKEFVFYNYPSFDRIQRLKNDKRKTVIIVDTDSNFLNLNQWVEFIFKFIVENNPKVNEREYSVNRFIAINTMCYLITNMIGEVLSKYTTDANIPKEYHPRINMKNEYLLSRIILSSKKKRYVGSTRSREGKEIFPEKIDTKGMDFIKSTTREDTKKYFTKLIEDQILKAEKIDIGRILKELEVFEEMIMASLHRGEKNFLIPASAKELASYADPWKMQPVRGVLAWNLIYPDNTIELPEKVDLIKVKLTNSMDMEKLKGVNEGFHDIIQKKIFGHPEPKISSKGVQVIALPRNIEKIPEWILPFIDYRTITTDNLKRFYSILESLGVQVIKNSKREFISNILKI